MSRLLHDRFLPIDEDDAWDLATGARVRLRRVAASEDMRSVDRHLGTCVDWGATPDGGGFEAWDSAHRSCAQPESRDLESLLELLDCGCDGEPRRLVLPARDGAARLGLWRLTARGMEPGRAAGGVSSAPTSFSSGATSHLSAATC